jgi:hypothetical protein
MISNHQVETLARSDAEFDGRDFDKLGRADRDRYLNRALAGLYAVGGSHAIELPEPVMRFSKVTRLEIIDDDGRIYTNQRAGGSSIHLQDGGRTMKVFAKGKNEIKPTVLLKEQAEAEVARLRELGWTQKDFADALQKLLGGEK